MTAATATVERTHPAFVRGRGEPDGVAIARAMYRTSIDHMNKGLAIFREGSSTHSPLIAAAKNPKLHACFVARPGKLPARETWLAAVSEYTPQGRHDPLYIVDHLKLLLPDFDNFGDKLDLAVEAMKWLSKTYQGESILYPTIGTEKALSTASSMDYAVSKYAIRKASKGVVTLRLDTRWPSRTYSFHQL